MTRSPSSLQQELEAAKREIDDWRADNDRRRQIPDAFWQRGITLTRAHSVNRVATAMRLSHERLRARMNSAAPTPAPAPSIRFVEVDSPLPVPDVVSKLSVELDGGGRRLRLDGADNQLVLDLVTTLFGRAAS